MAKALTYEELARLAWYGGNLRDEAAIAKAVAIAMRESRGVPDVVNVNKGGPAPGSHDVGLWQINTYYHHEWTEAQLLDPQTNAYAMGVISNRGTQWGAWDGPSYAQFLPEARKAAAKIAKDPGTLELLQTGLEAGGKAIADNPLQALAEAVSFLTDAVGTFFGAILDAGWWKRVGLGAASVILIAVGASLVGRDALVPPQLQALLNLAGKA